MLNSISFAKPVVTPNFKSFEVKEKELKGALKEGYVRFNDDFIWKRTKGNKIKLKSYDREEKEIAYTLASFVSFIHDKNDVFDMITEFVLKKKNYINKDWRNGSELEKELCSR